ncbi:hypothetical protein DW178_10265 [Eggerthella sp. AM16-19]|nr:hypothetical protein DW178_10265 [Eggerthella sp. AM16-19]
MRQDERNEWLANGSSECFAVNGVCCEARNRGDAVMLAEPVRGWRHGFRSHASLRARTRTHLCPPFMGLMQRESGR